jgi:uncharacterized protein YgbK (DUF1537 family)
MAKRKTGRIVIIADDLTGAADTAGPFAEKGLVTVVALSSRHSSKCDALALSTETRELAREEAIARTRRLCYSFLGRPGLIYKKMDSTLRGHPAAELAAVMDALRIGRALVAPAFPAQGRTTRGGRQLVNGVPIRRGQKPGFLKHRGRERRPARKKPGFSSASSDLVALFREVGPVRLVELSAVRKGDATLCEALRATGVIVADAETDADLAALARAATTSRINLFCGSAGLARALAETLSISATPPVPRSPIPSRGPVLIVAGSRHPSTVRQVAFARRRGMKILRLDWAAPERTDPALAETLGADLDVILTTPSRSVALVAGNQCHPVVSRGATGQGLAGLLGEMVRAATARANLGGLVLTGGEIAAAVCAALGASLIRLHGEVEPGIPWGALLDGARPGLPVVTKAGGFGGDDALVAAIQRLHAAR